MISEAAARILLYAKRRTMTEEKKKKNRGSDKNVICFGFYSFSESKDVAPTLALSRVDVNHVPCVLITKEEE